MWSDSTTHLKLHESFALANMRLVCSWSWSLPCFCSCKSGLECAEVKTKGGEVRCATHSALSATLSHEDQR